MESNKKKASQQPKKPELVKAGASLTWLGLFILIVTGTMYTITGNGPIAGLMFGFMFVIAGLILWGKNYRQEEKEKEEVL